MSALNCIQVSVFFEKVMALREDAVTAFCELHSLCLGHPDLQVPDFINFRFSRNVLRKNIIVELWTHTIQSILI
jgi:hypothetical protein